MSKSYLNKYENGKSQTLHARDRSNGAAHQSRVLDYLDDLETTEPVPVVITIPPARAQPPTSKAPMAQMMLFDQPVRVKAPEQPSALPAPITAPPAAPSTKPLPMLRPSPTAAKAVARPAEPFTFNGVLKGCGIGLAAAAGLLLAYTLIS